jgi:hypothetical protein
MVVEVISLRGGRFVGSRYEWEGEKAPCQNAHVPRRSSPTKW